MKNSCNRAMGQEEVKRKKAKVQREEPSAVVLRRTFTFFLFTFYFLSLIWPATGRSQFSSRRDRSRQDYGQDQRQDPRRTSGRFGGGPRPDSWGRPGSDRFQPSSRVAAAQKDATKAPTAAPGAAPTSDRITKSAEPNAPVPPVEHRPSHTEAQDEQWAPYKIILERNMFSRFRMRPGTERQRERPIFVPNPESYLLLKGIAQENNQFVALVEDKQTGTVQQLHQGDAVARGHVQSLTLDTLEYEREGKTTTVRLGFDLEGGQGALTAGDFASYRPTATPAGQSAAPAAPAADEADVLKRLMEQRQQQLGQ
jgi:hypothetical protein